MLQINFIHLHLLPVACLVATAKADGWDDFANNLATDLAPLLALFGEQATKQFLSESTTRWDNFIFAMAPLGILTAVVSAIRVCGGPSLRAFIGRAQEGGGIAEAELCSSTSRDVCELYHNGTIVRVFGRPKIFDIVHDREAADFPEDGDSQTTPKCGIYTFQEYVQTDAYVAAGWEELGKGAQLNIEGQNDPQRHDKAKKDPQHDVEAQKNPQHDTAAQNPPKKKQASDKFAPNPNLSFNIGIRKRSRHVTWLAATVGFLAQASVVVFGFLVTYTWGWMKDEHLPPAWAFPLTSLGTVILCGGMFSCAFLVESSTEERVFRRDPGNSRRPTIHVVQPGGQTVGDQTFDSFSFAGSTNEYMTSWKIPQHPIAERRVWLAIVSTMSGFVLQFVGMRAMHSAVSVLQLGAILLMSIIRAGLRTQRLGKDQNLLLDRPDEVEGHELDWLALQMAKGLEKEEPEKKDQGRKFWSVIAGPAKLYSPPDHPGPKPDTDSRQKDNAQTPERHPAQTAFFYRSRLAELTSQPTGVKSRSSIAWDERLVHVRQQALQLKKAIESSADVLLAHAKVKSDRARESITWAIDVAEYGQSESGLTPKKASKIYLSLHKSKDSKQSPTWAVSQQNLEAVVGLWAWSIISDPSTEEADEFKLRVSRASEVPASRIMAVGVAQEDIERARTDLKFWIGDFPSTSTEKWTAIPDRMESGPHTLWETQDEETVRKITATPMSPGSNQSRLRLFGWQSAELPDSHHSPSEVHSRTELFALTTTVSQSISATCAQDIYQSFLCAITADLDSIGGQTKPLRGSRGFYFENDVVSRLAECFKESGLGSTQDAYLVIIPALRCRSKLPLPGDALPAVHSVAETSRKEGNFEEAAAILKWAWQTALETYDGQDKGALLATMLELGELFRYALFWKDGSQTEFSRKGISWMEKQKGTQPYGPLVADIVDEYVSLATVDHSQPKGVEMARENDSKIQLVVEDQRWNSISGKGMKNLKEIAKRAVPELYPYINKYRSFFSNKLRTNPNVQRTRVAILDSGFLVMPQVQKDNEADEGLWPQIAEGKSFINNASRQRPWHFPSDSHGTQIANLISAIDPHCEIYVAKIVEGRQGIMPNNVAEAIEWAISKEVDIISMGFSIPDFTNNNQYSNMLREAVTRADRYGIIQFCSHHDEGWNVRDSWPANCSETNVVVACNEFGNFSDRYVGQYNYKVYGTDISAGAVPYLESNDSISGNSVATAIVAGVSSLMLSCRYMQFPGERFGDNGVEYYSKKHFVEAMLKNISDYSDIDPNSERYIQLRKFSNFLRDRDNEEVYPWLI
ncbi:Ankyrin repeat protein [Ilyonectria robusta]